MPVRKGDTHEGHSLLEPAAQGGAAPAEPVAVVPAHHHQLVLHQAGSQGGGEEGGDLRVYSGYLARQPIINNQQLGVSLYIIDVLGVPELHVEEEGEGAVVSVELEELPGQLQLVGETGPAQQTNISHLGPRQPAGRQPERTVVNICGWISEARLVVVERPDGGRVLGVEGGTARLPGVFPDEGKTVDIKLGVWSSRGFEGSGLTARPAPLPRPQSRGEGQHVGEGVVPNLHHTCPAQSVISPLDLIMSSVYINNR